MKAIQNTVQRRKELKAMQQNKGGKRMKYHCYERRSLDSYTIKEYNTIEFKERKK